MSLDMTLFLITSLLVIADFGFAGLFLFALSRQAKPDERPFVTGIAGLLLTVAVFNLFWIILITIGLRLHLLDNPLWQHIATALIIIIDIAAIIGRRRWWRQIIPVVKNGRPTKEEVPPDESEIA